jgi:hypothetical protein
MDQNEREQHVMAKFQLCSENYYDMVEVEFNKYKEQPNNKSILRLLKGKHPYLKRAKKIAERTDISTCKAHIYELLSHQFIKDKFTLDEQRIINEYCIRKICGLYKHAQAWKTGICNKQIINSFSEENTISICVTKNTLEANDQWLLRLFKELDNRFPRVSLAEKIMIISSKKNDLDGNATHCKAIGDAWLKLSARNNNFRILFVCSNKSRILDISEITDRFKGLDSDRKRNLRIIHDEAHNKKEGIPPFRDIIENIVAQPMVLSYQPVTATNGSIHLSDDDNNTLWYKENLENYAINFTEFDMTKSNDPRYSSCSDAIKISLTSLSKNSSWKDYEITEVSRELFMTVTDEYRGKTVKDLSIEELNDVDRRNQLEFCQFMKANREIYAVNNGINVLNLNEILEFEYYNPNKFNIHIIQTPNRKVVTRFISERAIEMNFNPIVLAIYGNQGVKYNLLIKDEKDECVDDIMGDGEFNEKLDKLFKYLKTEKINLNRPVIIIGNYTPTGESLSFVHYNYGVIRGVIKLISTNAEDDYQTACRGNYMNTKFKENNSQWINPEKYLIGEDNFLENAISYERENDARVDYLETENNDEKKTYIKEPVNNISLEETGGNIAIPAKVTIGDLTDPEIQKLLEIASIKYKNQDIKAKFIRNLQKCIVDPLIDCEIDDKTGKLDLNEMNIGDFRTYQSKEGGPQKGYWKFKNYSEHYDIETPFINNKNNHNVDKKQLDILIPKDRYILKDENGTIIETHSKSIWWIGYKY